MADPNQGYRIDETPEGVKFTIPKALTEAGGRNVLIVFVIYFLVCTTFGGMIPIWTGTANEKTIIDFAMAKLIVYAIWIALLALLFLLIFMRRKRQPTTIEIRPDGILINSRSFFPRNNVRGMFRIKPREDAITITVGLTEITLVRYSKIEIGKIVLSDLNDWAHRIWHNEN